jgi:hypothetical protein
VRREQVVGQGVEWRDCGRDEQETTGRERGDPPALRTTSPDREGIGDGEREDWEGRLEVRRPGIGIRTVDPATLDAARGRSSMAEP